MGEHEEHVRVGIPKAMQDLHDSIASVANSFFALIDAALGEVVLGGDPDENTGDSRTGS